MKRGVSIMFINGLVVAVVLLFSFGMDVTNRLVHQRYDQTVASQRALIACNNASKVFQQQSDELTLRVNDYVETDSTDALLAYFAIIDNQSREHEIEIAEQYDVDCTTLKQALALSDALAEREIHAFALMAAARGTTRTAPVQVQEYTLPLKERQLPDDEKKALAEQIVHGQEYYSYKNKIYEKLNDFETGVMERTEERLMVETESISSLLHVQNVFEIVEELVIICLALLLYRQVTVVLRKYIRSISRDEAIAPGGTSELRYLAAVINQYIALQNLVAQIHECIRADDFFARFGGDEFVIWMDGIQLGDVEAIKEKIQEVNHRTVLVANMTMRISISAGVTFCRHGDAYKDALRRVDTALYEMKRTGKHGCAVYEEL